MPGRRVFKEEGVMASPSEKLKPIHVANQAFLNEDYPAALQVFTAVAVIQDTVVLELLELLLILLLLITVLSCSRATLVVVVAATQNLIACDCGSCTSPDASIMILVVDIHLHKGGRNERDFDFDDGLKSSFGFVDFFRVRVRS